MAFNLQTFKTRTITAVFFVIIMLCGLLINHWTFFFLFSIIHVGAWFEYQKIISLIDKDYTQASSFHKYCTVLLGWGFMMYMTNKAYSLGNITLSEIGWWLLLTMIIVIPLTEVMFSKQFHLKSLGYSLLGLIYISLSCGLMMDLRNRGMIFKGDFLFADLGFEIPLTIIFSLWINDTMAYIVGSLIGKTPLSSVSPKKTWEGTLGGIILATLVSFLYCYFAEADMKLIAVTAITAITGTAGDLLESKLKRMANIKDSGSIMPGHGGFLDRFDSLIFAVPFVWLFVELFM